MDLDFFSPDKVKLQLSDGSVHDGVRAQFTQNGQILLPLDNLPIREGDVILRKLPNGIVQEFEVVHVDFQHSHKDLPPITTLSTNKRGSRLGKQQPSIQNVYNLSGSNPRVNVHSTDNSVNLTTIDSSVMFRDLRGAIAGLPDENVRAKLDELIDRLKQTQGTSSYIEPYKEFIAIAANCMTIVAPFLPALAQLLPS